MSKLLQPDQKQKQNHNRENMLVQQQPYRCTKEDGSTLSHQHQLSLRTIFRRKWSIFNDTIKQYNGKKMEQLNSARQNSIFEIIIHKTSLVWWSLEILFGCRRKFEKKISVLLWQFGNNYLPRALQGHSGSNLIDPTLQNNVLIGTGIFPYIYHLGCTFNLHSIINNGLVPGSQILSKRQSVFFLLVEMKITRTLNIFSLYHVSRDTCIVHGRDIKTWYFRSILILESKKD